MSWKFFVFFTVTFSGEACLLINSKAAKYSAIGHAITLYGALSKCRQSQCQSQNVDSGNGESQNGEHYAQYVATVATPVKKKEKIVIPICVFQHHEQSCAESGQSQCAHSCQWGFRFMYLELRNICVSVAESCRQLPVQVLIVELCRQIHQAVKFVHLSDL